jgi:DNA-binding beta-propeller fold protein YncE
MKTAYILLSLILISTGGACSVFAQENAVVLEKESTGIGFDDLGFSSALDKIIVPGGRTGKIFLIDPRTHDVSAISGFGATQGDWQKGHSQGPTSVDEGAGYLFVTDRSTLQVHALDQESRKITASASLGSEPDYVRFVSLTKEVWVTEPQEEQIEIFKFAMTPRPSLVADGFIKVQGGPESLAIDNEQGQAYTHEWEGKTVEIDLNLRQVKAVWSNGCEGSRGIALDQKRGFLFAGCAEGAVSVLDLRHDGKIMSSAAAGKGVDMISYNPARSSLYVPSETGVFTILDVSDTGQLSRQQEFELGYSGAHCVTNDGSQAWICDPAHGRISYYQMMKQ